jgi:hypothetical protein
MSDKNLSRLKKEQLVSLSQGLKDINNLLIHTLSITYGIDKAAIIKELRKKPADGLELFDRLDRISPENFKDLEAIELDQEEIENLYNSLNEKVNGKVIDKTTKDDQRKYFDFELDCIIKEIERGDKF